MNNMIIRIALIQTGVRAWEVAKYILKVSEPTYFRMMRNELPEKDQEIIAEKIVAYANKGDLDGTHPVFKEAIKA